MPENTAPALNPEQIPTKLVPHYVEPGTVYDDEPGELVPPGWYVLGDHGHGEGPDIEIKIEHAVDANGNDITGPLAAKIAELLAGFATEENDEAEAATPQSGAVVMTVPVTIDDDGTITPHDTGRMHLAEWWREHGANFTTAPRVPQPGDRVRVTWRKDGEFISSGRFTEDTVDANGDYTGVSDVQDGWATVEVIEPAPPPCSECTGTAGWPNPDCPVHGVVARVREEMAARSSSTNRPSSSTTPESGGTEEHGEPAPATEQPSESSEQRAKRVFVNRLKAAAVKCCKAGREAYPDPCPWHPADTGKEADR